jgi:TIGR03009 family protein
MRRPTQVSVLLIAGTWTAAVALGQTAPPRRTPTSARTAAADPAAEQARTRRLKGILAAWEKQSAGLRSLDVRFTRVDTSPTWDEKVEYRGQALLQSPDRAFLVFEKQQEPPRHGYVRHEAILCNGRVVLQYAYATKQIFAYPLSPEDRQRALEEGPLPFLFNMHARDLEARFRLALRAETKDAYVIDVLPRLVQDRESFGVARLWLNRQSYLPDKLQLLSPNGKDTKVYTFGAIHTNPAIDPTVFQPTKPADWTVIENPAPGPIAAPSPARPNARRSERRP